MNRYPIGTTQINLSVIVNNAGPVTGLTVNAKIYEFTTGLQFDFSDNTLKSPGAVVTPTLNLPESALVSGAYEATFDSSSVSTIARDLSVVYTSAIFIGGERIAFGLSDMSCSGDRTELVFDSVNRTLTIVSMLVDSNGEIVTSATSMDISISDEFGNVILSQTVAGSSGVFRHVFNNVQQVPNRVLLLSGSISFGSETFSVNRPIVVLGVSNA